MNYHEKRNHSGRRRGVAALSADAGRQQAASAGLRQADDLLSADHADAGRHPRDLHHLHAARPAALRALLGDGSQWGIALHLPRAARAQGDRPGVPDRRGFHRRRAGRADPGRQHLLRPL